MADTNTAQAEAQPQADANSIDSIVDNATVETTKQEIKPEPSAEPGEETLEGPWPDKFGNALAKAKGKAAQLRAERNQERMARQRLEQQLSQYNQPKQELSVAKTGVPTKLNQNNFTNYADFIEARAEEIADYKIDNKFKEFTTKQEQTQQNSQEDAYIQQRMHYVRESANNFFKENPDAQQLLQDNAAVLESYSPQLQRLLLEADNAPLALFNLEKEGKLEDLADMSLAKAAMEIGRAQTQAVKPKTKAPTPLPAARGSVPGGKTLESLSGKEMLDWMRSE